MYTFQNLYFESLRKVHSSHDVLSNSEMRTYIMLIRLWFLIIKFYSTCVILKTYIKCIILMYINEYSIQNLKF